MNKQELIKIVADQCGLTKVQSEKVVNTVFDSIIKSLASGKKVSIAGFGVWEVSHRPARKGVNPRNLSEVIQIPPTTVCRFRSGKTLKEAIK